MRRSFNIFLSIIVAFLSSCEKSEVAQEKTQSKPRVSVITSVWNGDQFIEGFLSEITKQTIFSECELILVNANSPGNEEPIIRNYMKDFPNIKYYKLEKDPGLYAVWNYAIKKASAAYITNANIDDRAHRHSFEEFAKSLDQNPDIDLVYSGYYITVYPNETFGENHHDFYADVEEFSPSMMWKCLPGPQPMWRKSMHDRFGYFDPSYISSGDWEMWLRAVSLGSKFKKIPGFYILFYQNPEGLSTNPDSEKATKRKNENDQIIKKYSYIWTGMRPFTFFKKKQQKVEHDSKN